MSRRKVKDEERRNKTIKVRVNDIEINELDRACEVLELEKSYIVREGIKMFLKSKNYVAE